MAGIAGSDAKPGRMTRRKAFLATLAICGGIAASAAPISSAAPATPVQCPPHPLVTQSEGNFYLWIPNPSHDPSCWTTVEIPGNIQQPPPPGVASAAAATPYPPQPCPTHVLLTQSDGNYYLWLPDPTRTTCWISVEIPGNIATPPPVGANGCPTQSPVYEANGHDYVIVPLNLDGNSPCGTPVELPVTVPPTF